MHNKNVNEVYREHLIKRKEPQGGVIMKIYPIATNTFNYNKLSTFSGNPEITSVVTTQPSGDVTQFKNAGGNNLKKAKSNGFITRLNAFFKPVDGVEKFDPRYSDSPWVHAYLY